MGMSGRGDWIRTSDLPLPKRTRYQASLRPDASILPRPAPSPAGFFVLRFTFCVRRSAFDVLRSAFYVAPNAEQRTTNEERPRANLERVNPLLSYRRRIVTPPLVV